MEERIPPELTNPIIVRGLIWMIASEVPLPYVKEIFVHIKFKCYDYWVGLVWRLHKGRAECYSEGSAHVGNTGI